MNRFSIKLCIAYIIVWPRSIFFRITYVFFLLFLPNPTFTQSFSLYFLYTRSLSLGYQIPGINFFFPTPPSPNPSLYVYKGELHTLSIFFQCCDRHKAGAPPIDAFFSFCVNAHALLFARRAADSRGARTCRALCHTTTARCSHFARSW